MIQAWTIVEAFGVGKGDELNEVFITVVVLCQEHEACSWFIDRFFIKTGARRNKGINANDRFDLGLLASLVEVDGAVEGTIIGNGHSLLAISRRRTGEFFGSRNGVEEGIVAVYV